jgi:large subunit ribosomal protein L25
MSVSLSIEARTSSTKAQIKALRASGKIPAVVYGKSVAPESVALSADEFRRFIVEGNRNRLVSLKLPSGATVDAFIKEITREKIRRDVTHIDFQVVAAGDTIVYRLPVNCVGVPVGVKIGGGNLNIIKKDIKVRVKPEHLRDSVDLDVSEVEKGGAALVSAIKLENAVVLTPVRQAVATVS